jgi:AbrB family looped-hinge helix DNA binding protein
MPKNDTIIVVQWRHRSETMATVTISPKYQVVIPKEVREKLGLRPGQKVQTIMFEDRIELIPVKPIKKMRGFLKGIDTKVPREADRT